MYMYILYNIYCIIYIKIFDQKEKYKKKFGVYILKQSSMSSNWKKKLLNSFSKQNKSLQIKQIKLKDISGTKKK